MSKRNAKYHTSHAKPSCPKSKITAVSQNKAFQNFKSNCKKYCDDRWHPQPPLMSTHICQRFRSLQKIPCLPCEWRSVRWLAPATQNNVSDLKSVLDAPRVPWKIDIAQKTSEQSEKPVLCDCEHAQSKWTWTSHKETFARACADKGRRSERAPWLKPGLYSYYETALVRACFGEKVAFHTHARVPVSHAFVLKGKPASKNAQKPIWNAVERSLEQVWRIFWPVFNFL